MMTSGILQESSTLMIKNGLLLYFNVLIFVKLEQEIETLMRL